MANISISLRLNLMIKQKLSLDGKLFMKINQTNKLNYFGSIDWYFQKILKEFKQEFK